MVNSEVVKVTALISEHQTLNLKVTDPSQLTRDERQTAEGMLERTQEQIRQLVNPKPLNLDPKPQTLNPEQKH